MPVIAEHLHLTESLAQFGTARPTAWLLLGPVVLLIGASCLPALDAVAEEAGVSRRNRIALVWCEATLVFLVVTMWGHPEDMVALGLALYRLLAGRRGRWTSAGWLWGGALAFQPLVVLLFPLALATTPTGRRLRVFSRRRRSPPPSSSPRASCDREVVVRLCAPGGEVLRRHRLLRATDA